LQRIREASMAQTIFNESLKDIVEVDEPYFGGNDKNNVLKQKAFTKKQLCLVWLNVVVRLK